MVMPDTMGSEFETCAKCGKPGDAYVHDIYMPEFEHPFYADSEPSTTSV